MFVEAEVGQIKGVEDGVIASEDPHMASKDQIKFFLEKTDVDLIAVAFGNAHGEYYAPPVLKYELVEYTTSLSDVPFVVHGGSGLSDDIIKRLIMIKGIRKINISTEVKLAYRRGVETAVKSGALEKRGFQSTSFNTFIIREFDELVHSKLVLLGETI